MNLLVLAPDPLDVTSYYRALGPLATLVKQFSGLEILTGGSDIKTYLWPRLRQADALFVQRPTSEGHLEVITQARDWGLPVWIDYDDDLLAVPKDNPCYAVYSNPGIRQAVPRCIELASVVTVTTPHLQSEISALNPNVRVIPNAFDDPAFLKTKRERTNRRKYVVWRGSNTHVRDLMEVAPAILELSERHPDWMWVFLGYDPFFITEKLKAGRWGAAQSLTIPRYMATLNDVHHAIQIVPLADNAFNRSKSNIAWIEASWAGAAVLAPDWGEWQRPGVMNYHGLDQFKSKLEQMMSGEIDTGLLNAQSWEHIERTLLLTQVNHQRFRLIHSLRP